MGFLDPDHARAEAELHAQQQAHPEAHAALVRLGKERAAAPAFGPDRAPACAATSVPGTAVLAFQRVAQHHQAECYCESCGESCSTERAVDDWEHGESVAIPCPGCGENALMLIDAQTANLVVRLHRELNPENRAKLETFSALRMAVVALRLLV